MFPAKNALVAVVSGSWLVIVGCVDCRSWAQEPARNSPLNKSAFAATANELLQTAAAQDPHTVKNGVEVLLEEHLVSVAADGMSTVTNRRIIRFTTRAGFDEYGVIQATWSPWYEHRPELKARVISPKGKVHELDVETIEKIRIPSANPQVFTDVQLLRAPLPMLMPGCLAETQVVVREHRAFSRAGSSKGFQFGFMTAHTRLSRFRVDVPTHMPLHHQVLGSPAPASVTTSDGRRALTVVLEGLPPLADQHLESHLPGNISPVPLIVYSTAPSWRDVAREYTEIVQRQSDGSNLDVIVHDTLGTANTKSQSQRIAALLRVVQQRVRYTSLSFGDAAIVPQKPAVTLKRGYGDCKDLAALLVGLLRAADVEAHVALIKSGPGLDKLPDVPGLAGFDHVIVQVPGDPPLWIDPTCRFTSVGHLPWQDQGRWALVVDWDTSAPVQTPTWPASENRVEAHYVMSLLNTGSASVASEKTYHGAFATIHWNRLEGADSQTRKEWLSEQGLERFHTGQLTESNIYAANDGCRSLRVTAEYADTPLGIVEHPEAVAILPLYEVLDLLPFHLTGHPDTSLVTATADQTNNDDTRRQPLWLPFPFQHEVTYQIVAPPGFVAADLPLDQAITLGPANLAVLHRRGDGCVQVTIRFDSGSGRFSAEEVKECRQRIEALGNGQGYGSWQSLIRFEETAGKHLAAGRIQAAIEEYRELLRQYPDDPALHSQMARAAVQMGLVDYARDHARRAVMLGPTQSYAHHALGYALSHNHLGQWLAFGFERNAAVAAYRKALELDAEHLAARCELAMLLEHDEHGVRYANPQFTDAAIVEYRRVLDAQPDERVLDALVTSLFVRGQSQAARQLLEAEAASPLRDLNLLTVIAAADGVDACLQRAATLHRLPAERQSVLEQIIDVLSELREFEAAASLARRVADRSPQRDLLLEYAKRLESMQRYSPDESHEDSPVGTVRQLLAQAFVHGPRRTVLSPFFTRLPADPHWEIAAVLPPWLHSVRTSLLQSNLWPARMADVVHEFEIDSAGAIGTFHRVRVIHSVFPEIVWTTLVVQTGDGFRVAPAGDDRFEWGARALRLLTDGEEEQAKGILAWAYDDLRGDLGWFDSFRGSPFARLWRRGRKEPDDVRLAAAALAAGSESAEDALRILMEPRPKLPPAQQLQVDRALTTALATLQDFDTLNRHTADLFQEYPRSFETAWARMVALGQLQALEQMESILGDDPHHPAHGLGLLLLAERHSLRGDLEAAATVLSRVPQRKDQLPAVFKSHFAVLSVFQNQLSPDSLAWANEAYQELHSGEYNGDLNSAQYICGTHALVLAEQRRFAEAVEALWSIPAMDPDQRPHQFDKYVLARIADGCGLREHAAELYGQIEDRKAPFPDEVFALGQKRMTELAHTEN